MVIVSVEYEPATTGFATNNLPMLTPGRLVKEASAGCGFVTPFAVVTAPCGMTFVRLPFTVIVALRVRVQLPKAGRLPPLKEKEVVPETPLSVPPHVPTSKFRGLARIIPLGMLSVNAMPDRGTALGLINCTLMVEAEPPKTVSGLKPFTKAMDKLPLPVTVKLEVRLLDGTRFSVFVMFEGGMVFVYTPGVTLVTYTSIRHRCPARIKPLLNEIEIAPVGALSTSGGVAPQPLVDGGVELLTVTPVGRLSVIEKFVRFVSNGARISILNLELPPAGIEEGENDFNPVTSVPAIVTLDVAARRFPTP